MEFSIEYFKQSPTVEALYTCRKSDLILVTDYYHITISKVATKKTIRDVVQENLVAEGVLIIEPKSRDMDAVSGTDGDKAEASAQFPTVDLNPLVGLNTTDLKLAIQLKELDLRVKQQEHDTQLLRVRQCELEAHRVSPRLVSGLQTPMTSVFYLWFLLFHISQVQVRLISVGRLVWFLILGKRRSILTSVRSSG